MIPNLKSEGDREEELVVESKLLSAEVSPTFTSKSTVLYRKYVFLGKIRITG